MRKEPAIFSGSRTYKRLPLPVQKSCLLFPLNQVRNFSVFPLTNGGSDRLLAEKNREKQADGTAHPAQRSGNRSHKARSECWRTFHSLYVGNHTCNIVVFRTDVNGNWEKSLLSASFRLFLCLEFARKKILKKRHGNSLPV